MIADEPVSALDVSIQAQVINLLQDLKEQLRLSLLFISHDIAVMRHIADRIAVMYQGKLEQVGTPLEGRIITVHVLVGQRVSAGDPLVTLDCPDAATMRASAAVALRSAA